MGCDKVKQKSFLKLKDELYAYKNKIIIIKLGNYNNITIINNNNYLNY
jgi:hypothetical protein